MSRTLVFTLLLLGFFCLFSTEVLAADLYVNASTGDDSNDCTSVEEACSTISRAHAVAAISGDTINLAPGTYSETYDATYGIYVAGKSFSLVGVNAATTFIDGGGNRLAMRILDLTNSNGVSIEKITIQNGHPNSTNGGCLLVQIKGDLTLTDVVMKDCAVDNHNMAGCLLHTTYGDGSDLTINRSYFTNCTGKEGSAMISEESSDWTGTNQISNSTFYSNTVANAVGATVSIQNPTTFTNNTFYSNDAGSAYGAIYSTVRVGETVTLINNLFADANIGGSLEECYPLSPTSAFTSGGGNVSTDADGSEGCQLSDNELGATIVEGTDIAASVSTTDNGVGYLAIPGTGSDLYNTGTNTSCASADVREISRPQFTTCDVGAFEFSAVASVSPSSASLSTSAGSSTISPAITFTNDSSVSIDVNSIDITGDSVFTVTSDNCTGESIAGSGTCTFKIQYAPTEEGTNSGTATVDSDAANSPTVTLTGIASAELVPALSKAPSSIAFGNVSVGTTSDCETVTVTSSGTGALSITTVQLSDTESFLIESDFCENATLAVDETCTMSVCFSPASGGDETATISVTSNAATSPDSITLSGTGVSDAEGTFTFSSDSLSFLLLISGSEQKCSTTTATNIGGTAATVSDVSISDDASSVFLVSEDGCEGQTVAVNGTCSMSVCFSRVDYDQHTATLTMTSDAASSPDTVALSGQAYRARVNSLDVEMVVQVGQTQSQLVTVTVEGDSPVIFGDASISSSVEASLSKSDLTPAN